MKYFKNTELAKLYRVSEKSVRNWIDSAKQGRIELQLYDHDGKSYIANTAKNTTHITQLVERGKKYKNKRGYGVIEPTPKFYRTYSQAQIFDIVTSIRVHREIPLQYSYVEDASADYWNQYTERLAREEAPNMLRSSMQSLELNFPIIDRLLAHHDNVNVIDLGPGNAMQVQGLLERLLKQKRLNRYIALDISQEMIQIAQRHVRQWFDGRVAFEGHVHDFSHQRFDHLLLEDYVKGSANPPINVVLLLGGTLCNFRSQKQALDAAYSSLGPNDLVIYGAKLDTPTSRRYFDFAVDSTPKPLDYLFKAVVDLLNIDETLYTVDQFFDDTHKARFICLKPKIDLELHVKLGEGVQRIELHKNERIILWRYWHHSALDVIEQFDRSGFELLHATKSPDQENILLISKIKTTAAL